MKISILAMGKLKPGPEKDLLYKYLKRMHIKPTIIECTSERIFIKQLNLHKNIKIALDEKGSNFSTYDLKDFLSAHQEVMFLIGSHNGFPKNVKFDTSISFGKMTWPHLLIRPLLVEQLYRIQQINCNHPYHKE